MKNKSILIFSILFSFAISCNQETKEENNVVLKKKQVLTSEQGAKVLPKFISLTPGQIKPEGWIHDWANTSLSGITGHLDEWSNVYGEAWKAKGFEATGANPDGTGWPLEQASYWLDGAIRLAYIMKDSALIKKVSSRLDLVVDGVLNGGETFIYWKPKDFIKYENDKDWELAFNNWSHSHMGRALVAYYEATGNEKILDALIKVYKDYPLPQLPEHFDVVTGAVNIDPMLDVYMLSGNEMILETINAMVQDPKFDKVVDRWINGDFINGHGVITYENIRVPATVYPWTGNRKHLEATTSSFSWLDNNHMLPYGIASSEENTAGIGSTRNTETCNVAASTWSYLSLYKITGSGSYGDRIEKVFFNAGPAPVARDFKTMSYYQSPNRIGNIVPIENPVNPMQYSSKNLPHLTYEEKDAYKFRNTGHPVLCCVGNLNRVIPNYIMHMWMTTLDDGLAATLYGPSLVKATVGDNVGIEIKTKTNYPFEQNLQMDIIPAKKVEFPLYLRIPDWTSDPTITINGDEIDSNSAIDGFVKIQRVWRKGDKLKIDFPMKVFIAEGNETPYPQVEYFTQENERRLTKVKEINNPFQSIYYGPLLFALPLDDIDPNEQAEDQKWNFALNVDQDNVDGSVNVVKNTMPDHWQWQLDAPIKLEVPVKEFDWQPSPLQPLPKQKIEGGKNRNITLVPYGTTKFRVSMFPVSEE